MLKDAGSLGLLLPWDMTFGTSPFTTWWSALSGEYLMLLLKDLSWRMSRQVRSPFTNGRFKSWTLKGIRYRVMQMPVTCECKVHVCVLGYLIFLKTGSLLSVTIKWQFYISVKNWDNEFIIYSMKTKLRYYSQYTLCTDLFTIPDVIFTAKMTNIREKLKVRCIGIWEWMTFWRCHEFRRNVTIRSRRSF